MSYVFRNYKYHCAAVLILIFLGVIANVQGTMFMKNLIDDYITPFLLTDQPNFAPLAKAIGRVACFYAVGIISTYLYNRIMVNVTQGTLRDMRDDLFEHMQKLPIKYFDTHAHGDIMSVYTNDIDTLRQMISQSIPQVINSGFTIISVFVSMLILNIPLTIVTLIMVGIMITCSKAAAGRSGKYFLEQQRNLGAVNGHIEEMMNGQKAELPSAPKQFIQYLEEDNRPQVKMDVDYENGMGVSIGRLREDSIYDYKFIGLSHNTVRGAAGGAVLCAESLTAKGYIQAK